MTRKIYTEDLIRKELKEKRPDLKIISVERINYINRVTVSCENNHIYTTSLHNLFNGKKCKICSGQKVEVGVSDLKTTRVDLIKFLKDKNDAYKYMENSNSKIIVVCPICNHEKEIRVQHLSKNGLGCIYCSDKISAPNKFLRGVLKQLNLDYELEKKFDDNNYRYDAFVDSKFIIEMNGIQHYKTTNYGKVEDISKNDELKREYAESIELIQIDVDCRFSDFEFIKGNFIASVGEYIDLTNIDWDLVFKSMNLNILVEICKAWNEDKSMLPGILAKEFMLDKHTIIRYLKTGNSIGLCKYDSIEEMRKSARRNWSYNKNKE